MLKLNTGVTMDNTFKNTVAQLCSKYYIDPKLVTVDVEYVGEHIYYINVIVNDGRKYDLTRERTFYHNGYKVNVYTDRFLPQSQMIAKWLARELATERSIEDIARQVMAELYSYMIDYRIIPGNEDTLPTIYVYGNGDVDREHERIDTYIDIDAPKQYIKAITGKIDEYIQQN